MVNLSPVLSLDMKVGATSIRYACAYCKCNVDFTRGSLESIDDNYLTFNILVEEVNIIKDASLETPCKLAVRSVDMLQSISIRIEVSKILRMTKIAIDSLLEIRGELIVVQE